MAIDSLMKLRTQIETYGVKLPHYNAFKELADKIEDEIEKRYFELPLDADNAPIRIGDVLYSDEYAKTPFPCRGLSVDVRNGTRFWTVCMAYDAYSGTSEYVSAKSCHHVKHRTVEDVLNDLLDEDVRIMYQDEYQDQVIAKYADEIRDILKESGQNTRVRFTKEDCDKC